jgi:hypothetical protein
MVIGGMLLYSVEKKAMHIGAYVHILKQRKDKS